MKPLNVDIFTSTIFVALSYVEYFDTIDDIAHWRLINFIEQHLMSNRTNFN